MNFDVDDVLLIMIYVYQVIYVKTGMEADLDSLIKDTIRLTASAKVMHLEFSKYAMINKCGNENE